MITKTDFSNTNFPDVLDMISASDDFCVFREKPNSAKMDYVCKCLTEPSGEVVGRMNFTKFKKMKAELLIPSIPKKGCLMIQMLGKDDVFYVKAVSKREAKRLEKMRGV